MESQSLVLFCFLSIRKWYFSFCFFVIDFHLWLSAVWSLCKCSIFLLILWVQVKVHLICVTEQTELTISAGLADHQVPSICLFPSLPCWGGWSLWLHLALCRGRHLNLGLHAWAVHSTPFSQCCGIYVFDEIVIHKYV